MADPQPGDLDDGRMTTFLEQLKAAREATNWGEVWPIDLQHGVLLTPKQAEYICLLVNNAEKIERLIKTVEDASVGGKGCPACKPFEGCHSTLCESVEDALAALNGTET